MSEADVEAVSRGYEIFNAGGLEAVAAAGLLADDFSVDFSRRMIDPDAAQGADAARAIMRDALSPWETARMEVTAIHDAGDGKVVAAVTLHTRGAASGAEVAARAGHLWTRRDGRSVSLVFFQSFEEALAAAAEG